MDDDLTMNSRTEQQRATTNSAGGNSASSSARRQSLAQKIDTTVRENRGLFCRAVCDVLMPLFNTINHMIAAVVVFTCCFYAAVAEESIEFKLHIILCVTGYKLVLAEAIMCMGPCNGWSSKYTKRQRWTTHSLLYVAGSAMALAGGAVVISSREVNFDTTHGILGLSAMACTAFSLVGGLLIAVLSKISSCSSPIFLGVCHIVSGCLTQVVATIALWFALNYDFFREWTTDTIGDCLKWFIITSSVITLFSPIGAFSKSLRR